MYMAFAFPKRGTLPSSPGQEEGREREFKHLTAAFSNGMDSSALAGSRTTLQGDAPSLEEGMTSFGEGEDRHHRVNINAGTG